ncbi:winged helix DNA-binding domain-containing protein [Bdellovibrio sp. SKB1291214]|uniref:winged helix-turn-helix domain-containing protein n=1 Tax=Bdellovibrio sp. SKB1291214 TaxID=1732569 RepID=UPI000B518E11|nr:crosslink repair DNA glycosylase YcaQ family protein [Bdellovibrio sp. SKB1291214]UYL09909.1 winged helix DNA-binding domain-containing protein [Bdellovibrio sp. SKB1291214]
MSKVILTPAQVRAIWLQAQGLDQTHSFGSGKRAVVKAIKHLGYVQIDTIHVIERSHHHILYSRIPDYKRSYLHQAQTKDKTVFEYWTHALAYIATDDFKYFMNDMKRRKDNPSSWYSDVTTSDIKKVVAKIKKEGPISIRDVNDEELIEKNHPWASKKPSKRHLQAAFNGGDLVISERVGMLKKYQLTNRHFGWSKCPKAARPSEVSEYHINRALQSQGVVSLDSICYMEKAAHKKEILKCLDVKVRKGALLPVEVEGVQKHQFWIDGKLLESEIPDVSHLTHILSPFDPLVIQRKRFNMFFGYDHRFEAYLPKEKRKYGYFTLPVIIGDQAVAVLDLKTDRQNRQLLIQQWSWLAKHKSKSNKQLIEAELNRFEKFQLAAD